MTRGRPPPPFKPRKGNPTMAELKTYHVVVREVYRRTVAVRATSRKDAERRAWDGWLNGEIILTEDDFHGVEHYALDEGEECGAEEKPAGDLVIQGYGAEDKDEGIGKGTAKHGQ